MHYYMVVGLVVLFLSWWMNNKETLDTMIFVILVIYVLVFPVVIVYTRKYAVHIFFFMLAFITGFYSFYHYSVEPHSILNALYFTFQLYLLIVADVFTEDGSSLLQYPLILEIARWSAALYTISTLFIAMYRLLETSILLVFYQIIGNHYVVFGYNENSLAFVEDLRKKKKRVILVANHLSNEAEDYLEELKVVVLHHRDDGENIHTQCRIARAQTVVLLHKEDVDNLNELMDIHDYFEKHSKKNLRLTVYIHLQEVTSRRLFLHLEGMKMKESRHFQVRPINLYALFVDALFEKYPVYTSKREENPIHLFIVGFGPLGQHIALKGIAQSGDHVPHITAVDKYMPKIEREWYRSYQDMNKYTSISFHSFDAEKDMLEPIIHAQNTPVTHIYVCLHEDKLDLWEGIELSDQFPDIPIYLEFSEGSIAEKWIQSGASGNRLVYGTGTFKDLLTEEKLLK